MRPTSDLLELPYSFAMNRPLMPDRFHRELRDRGIRIVSGEGLETLHKLRLLVPLLRVRRDRDEIMRAYRQDPDSAWQVANWHPTARADLLEAATHGRLTDPARERFMSRDERRRPVGELTYESSVYLYSAQQLITVPVLTDALPWLSPRPGPANRNYNAARKVWIGHWAEDAQRLREIATAGLALEPLYLPRITGILRLEWDHDADAYYEWREQLPPLRMLSWLSIEPDWLRNSAARLLRMAEVSDPLGPWSELLAHADSRQWDTLKGTARTALELRVAAEMLLRYYERLVKARRAKALPPAPTRFRTEFDRRLKTRRPVDAVLTNFGLSPHPRLVLVVEGATERLLFPRVMEHFGVRTDDDFISVQDAEGVGRRLDPLVAYLAPRVGKELQEKYVELVRPPIRLLVVVDAEGPMASGEQREGRRQQWLNRIVRTLPREWRQNPKRLAHMRDQLDGLVQTDTWKRTGVSFEFAHFTDRQLAQAIERLDRRTRRQTLEGRTKAIARVRADRGNLKTVMGGVSKPDLADELWPVLEKRLRVSQSRGTERRIPIVRVLDHAISLAHEYPRRGLVLSLEETEAGSGQSA